MVMRQALVRLFGCAGGELEPHDLAGLGQRDDVILTLPRDIKIKKLVRNIVQVPPGTNPTGSSKKVPPPKAGTVPRQTPIDMDIAAILGNEPSYCRIRVRCADPAIRFADPPQAITAADDGGKAMFFNLLYGEDEGMPAVRFDCIRPAVGPQVGSFNIGLVISDGNYELPIIIDPKIQNRG
jgi:hypothetical protein